MLNEEDLLKGPRTSSSAQCPLSRHPDGRWRRGCQSCGGSFKICFVMRKNIGELIYCAFGIVLPPGEVLEVGPGLVLVALEALVQVAILVRVGSMGDEGQDADLRENSVKLCNVDLFFGVPEYIPPWC